MKNFFKGLGKGILYFFIYLSIQSAVSAFYTIIYMIYILATDFTAMMDIEFLINEILSHTTIISLLSNIVAALVIWLVFVIRKKNLFQEIQLTKCGTKNVVLTLLIGISFGFVSDYIIGLIPFPTMLTESFEASYALTSAGNPIVNFIAVAILAPIVEEVFFRGLIYTRMRKGMSAKAAIILSSLVFGLAHGEIIWILSAFSMGVVLAWVFEKTGSLLPCIIIHAVNNTLSIILEDLPETSEMVDLIIIGTSAVIFAASLILFIKNYKKTAALEGCGIIYEESEEESK